MLLMTAAGQSIAGLQRERRSGNVSSQTDLPVRTYVPQAWGECSCLDTGGGGGGRDERLEREAAALRKLSADLFDVMVDDNNATLLPPLPAGPVIPWCGQRGLQMSSERLKASRL